MIGNHYDLIVIGGGINGAGIARDAVQRGMSVLLLEKNDFGSGTSSWSSRLIHGGLRYLEYAELSLVYESLHDRSSLLKVAPHLVKPLEIAIPIFKYSERGPLMVRLGMIAYDLLSVGKQLPRHKMLNARETLERFPALNQDQLKGAAVYFDAQVEFAERLVFENVLAAADAGAVVRNYCEVTDIEVEAAHVKGVRWRDSRNRTSESATADHVVNAGGPWVDDILETARSEAMLRYMGGTKGSHIVLPVFEGAPDIAFYVEAESDGRPIFFIPWNQQLLVGTTDIRVNEPPERVTASDEEVRYLLNELNRVFPEACMDIDSVSHRYSGVRPLARQTDGPESAISRKHLIKHHNHIARGLYSIIGGKLTTYRSLAEDFLKRLNKDFDLDLPPAETSATPLPGARGLKEVQAVLLQTPWLSSKSARHLLDVYGARARDVLESCNSEEKRSVICRHSRALAGEVIFAIRYEFAKTIDDVMNRRTMMGLAPDRGYVAAAAVVEIMRKEFGWTDAQAHSQLVQYRDYIQRRFSARVPASPSVAD